MNLYNELKRRNVIRAGGLYLVGAWLIVQVAETVLPIFDTPGWVLKALVVLLALGFVPTMVVAWVYELTPDGLKRDADVAPGQSIAWQTSRRMDRLIVLGLVAVIAVVAADRYWPRSEPTESAARAATATGDEPTAVAADAAGQSTGAQAQPGKSIAVLPFVNMSADEENAYFADGISEELLNVLVRVEDIGVASRTSSFAYKGREIGAATIARELKVNHILEGSVRKSGSRVRITAQLIDAVNDRHLWSETYDRELTDIFAIQDEIANAIVAALRGTLGSDDTERAVTVRADTENLDAYQLYLKARELFVNRERLDESVRLFERVVALDAEFARGWEGLAAASAVIVDWVGAYPSLDRARLLAQAEQAAQRALALDPTLSMPWAARSLLVSYALPIDFQAALALLDRAVAADPNNATAHLWRGILWFNLGFLDRALADIEQCLALDPAYGNCLRWKAVTVLFQGDIDAALALYQQGMAKGFVPNRGNSFVEPLIRRGNRFAAILLMREMDWPLEVQQAVVATLGDDAAPPDFDALAQRYPQLQPDIGIRLLLRDYQGAAAQVAADTASLTNTLVEHWDPAYQGLRAAPAFKRILALQGVPVYWREHGYPPQCRPVGADDFECE